MSPLYRRAMLALSIKVLSVFLAGATEFTLTSNAFAATGDLFVTDLSTNSIVVYSPDGTVRTFAEGLDNPQGLAFDKLGNLYEADAGSGNIYKFAADGTRTVFASDLLSPVGLAFRGLGLLVAENGRDQVTLISPNSTKVPFRTVDAPLSVAFDNLSQDETDPNPEIWVASNSDPTTSFVLEIKEDGTTAQFLNGLDPRDIAFASFPNDPAVLNNAFVSTGSGTIYRISTTNGNVTTFATGLGEPNGLVIRPRRFSDDETGVGNLLVADTAGGNIFELTPDGVQTTFASGTSNPNYLAIEPNLLGKLANISTRLRTLTGDNVLIGGFIITGDVSLRKKVILRAIGPSLSGAGVAGALADPVLELHHSVGGVDMLIASNDNWKANQQAAIEATTIPPTNDLESAIVATLAPGPYTAIVRGKNNGTGVALVEVYDLDTAAASELANISTRGFVDTGDNVMIGGFIIDNDPAKVNEPARVLIRAIGPTLSDFGVPNPLQDPTLELHDANGNTISNDDWADTAEGEIQATGIPPGDARESAILANLTPGGYTAVVRGKDNTTGVALVEVYRLQ